MERDCWALPEIGWPELRIHPLHLLDEEDFVLLQLWRASQGGLSGPGPLPEAGGLLDQPACVMACFDVMSAAEAAIKKAVRREHG